MIPAGGRRLKIRPPRKPGAAPDIGAKAPFDYTALWATLASAIVHIQNRNVLSLLYEQLYRIAYTVVLHKHGARLYDDVAGLVTQHLQQRRQRVLELLASLLTDAGGDFLKRLCHEWARHVQLMKFLGDVLMYLNRVYVKESRRPLVGDLGVALFATHFLGADDMAVARRLVHVLTHEMARLRGQALCMRLYVVQMIAMLETVSERRGAPAAPGLPGGPRPDLYRDVFEHEWLVQTEAYFSAAADDAMAARLGSAYLHRVHRLVHDEEERLRALAGSGAGALFRTETAPKTVVLMDNILIRGRMAHVMDAPAGALGLRCWLEPVFACAVARLAAPPPPGDARGHTAELRMLYDLEGRVDPERKRLKARVRELLVAQGGRLAEAVLRHLQQQAALAAAGLKMAGLKTAGSKTAAPKTPAVSYGLTAFVVAWIDTVLEFQRLAGQLVQDAFGGDASVEFTVLAAVKQFLNRPAGRPKTSPAGPALNAPELLSVYIDHYIKQFSKPSTSKKSATDDTVAIDETEAFFHKVVTFLKLVEDKYAFEAHYAAHFAKRFLNAKGAPPSALAAPAGDIEELVLAKLWDEVFMGSHYLERIVKMRKDVTLSAELTLEWRRHVADHALRVTELELKICNLSEWPKSMTKDHKDFSAAKLHNGASTAKPLKDASPADADTGIIWPSQLRETMRTFEEFWRTGKRNDNKALFWYPKFGQMDLRISYPSRTYDINLSTYGGVIMMLFAPQSTDAAGDPVLAFDEQRELTYDEIRELTRIPEFDLKRQLRSIAVAPRLRLLVKVPMSKDINPTDTFRLNSKFKLPSTKVKVLTVKSDAPKISDARAEEADEVRAAIDEGRKHLINAAVVRTMKSRQTIKHNELIEEIVKQLQNRFLPPMVHIKQQVEDLIEKEYLRRDADSPNVYHYIA
ncbi:Cullin-domain-containing protein [Metschnikowia bicuspidata var. bicuspidata NRRL YB-4993]|uniref:Cullin-domain-containing protein n=1 Tax=Metschnikowia bicuspidata var. bicuspidata NRRL YB-4993 TaxID=869754 RepID=A0A1A0H8W8_9ASCO|nr:Cullin-domain-containing protein [Metschnikowia bicuspidata var. bicuspidata NRRL YB-4993]OBA20445.1 Cullin-domain-containing protein [Metschnikowia bicuspidata var. bicuspidata NRRL YB-4993]